MSNFLKVLVFMAIYHMTMGFTSVIFLGLIAGGPAPADFFGTGDDMIRPFTNDGEVEPKSDELPAPTADGVWDATKSAFGAFAKLFQFASKLKLLFTHNYPILDDLPGYFALIPQLLQMGFGLLYTILGIWMVSMLIKIAPIPFIGRGR